MIVTLTACLYISFVCLLWGTALLDICFRSAKISGHPPFIITTLLGLSVIAGVSGILSLFMPLGGIRFQVLILLPALLYAVIRFRYMRTVLVNRPSIKPVPLLLFISLGLLVLIMNSWTIIHPDTIGYHAQAIKWIEEHRVIPGLVNLQPRLGLQNSWFILSAVFAFDFTGTAYVTFINSTLLIWFLIFITGRINEGYIKKDPLTSLFWLILAGYCIWSYPMIRLTATSASPDFIAIILTWITFWSLFCEKHRVPPGIILLFSVFAFTVKLSVAPLLFLGLYCLAGLVSRRKTMEVSVVIILCFIILFPFITRNIITSGYPLFPAAFPDLSAADWKFPEKDIFDLQHYITGYARGFKNGSEQLIMESARSDFSIWLPVWWKGLAFYDKSLLGLFLAVFLTGVIRFRNLKQSDKNLKVLLFVSLAGSVFWFWNAPDPRFGYGFLIAFIAIMLYLLKKGRSFPVPRISTLRDFAILVLLLSVNTYSVYRLARFFEPEQIIVPLGMEKISYKTVKCGTLEMYIPVGAEGCGGTPLPCTTEDCSRFLPRGNSLESGFRPIVSP